LCRGRDMHHIVLSQVNPFNQRNIETTILLSFQFPFPPQLPMFDIVSDKLLKLSSTAQQKLSHQKIQVTPETFYKTFSDLVRRDPISKVVVFIDDHPAILHAFKEDFIKRTLQMSSMTSIWLDVCVTILDGLCIARGKADTCRLYVIKVCFAVCSLCSVKRCESMCMRCVCGMQYMVYVV
jgi:hypothetical protein